MKGLRQAYGILCQFARIGVVRKSQFRFEFVNQVVMDCLWYATHILTFEILFGHTSSIAGWSLPEVRVFLGFLFCTDAFMMMWLGQTWHFGRELRDGQLDTLRVRPAPPVLVYFFQRFSLEGTANMAIAGGYLTYALSNVSHVGTPWLWIVLPWALMLAWWGRTVIAVLFTIWEFYFVHSDLARFSNEALSASGDNPLDIFSARLRQFFLHLVPVGAFAHIPASMVLGRFSIWASLGHSLWLVLFGLVVFRCWRRGFRRYESAMG